MTALSTSEQERLAYIQGDLAKAELLGALLDAQAHFVDTEQRIADAYEDGWDDGHAVGVEEGKE